MLSDVLHDALCEIERHQLDCQDVHAPLTKQIGIVKLVIDSLRLCLDAPPWIHDRHQHRVTSLVSAIGQLDLSAVEKALQELLSCLKHAPDEPVVNHEFNRLRSGRYVSEGGKLRVEREGRQWKIYRYGEFWPPCRVNENGEKIPIPCTSLSDAMLFIDQLEKQGYG